MISPSNPGQGGSKEVLHDNMNDAGHEAQFKHADSGETIKDEVSEENTHGKGY